MSASEDWERTREARSKAAYAGERGGKKAIMTTRCVWCGERIPFDETSKLLCPACMEKIRSGK